MKKTAFIAILIMSTVTFAQSTTASAERKGLLFEIGLGGGLIALEDSNGVQSFDDPKGGFSFPELKVGYMLHDKLAIALSMPGMIYDYNKYDRHFGGALPTIQYWVKDRWWIQAGLGLAIDAPALYEIKTGNNDWHFGCAALASSGYEVYQKDSYAANVQAKVLLGRTFLENNMHRDAVLLSIGLGFSCF